MQKKSIWFMLAATALASAAATPAQAQSRTWVSGVGDDSFACSRTAPCKTFAGAFSKTATGGEINCLDPGGFGTLTINKSITVDCSGTNGNILASGTIGITINTDAAPGMIVRLRGLSINGTLTGSRGIQINGTGSNDNAISIENCVLDGFTTFGIQNSAKIGRLLVKDTVVRNNFGTAVGVAPAAGNASTVKATLDNVSTFDSTYGFAFGNGIQAVVKNSIASGHVTAGVEADAGATVSVVSSIIMGNVTGIVATAGSTIRVRDSDIASNTTGVSGTVQSHVNNSFINNGAGGTITPVAGGVTNPQGLQ
jgi:hypothetical protein